MKENARRELPNSEQLKAELARESYKSRYKRVLRSTVYTLIVVAAISVLVATLFMPVLQIYGTSMTPTLQEGEIVLSIKSKNFNTGDLVAFYLGNRLLVKRCIAGPGDWVNIDEEGNIYVNDVLLDEPYVQEKSLGDCNIELPMQVPENRWFLVGDHRATSVDSRHTSVGCVSEDQIEGKIIYRVWPFSALGAVE